jgi:hypothetical protein
MYMWGVMLMIVGGLSFVLPLFGRQFLLVSALGLTGAAPILVGVTLFVVGLLLYTAAKKTPVAPARPARPPAAAPRSPAAVPAQATAATNLIQTAAAPATSDSGRFALGGSDYTDPYDFGLGLVRGSVDGSQKMVGGMIGSAEMPSQLAIKSNHGPVQLHALALISATYYLCANKVSSTDRHALTRLATGLVDGFAAIFDSEARSESAQRNALSIYDLVKDYAQSLSDELNSLDPKTVGDDPFDMGATARLLVHNIAGQCGIQEALTASHLERLMLERIGRDCGILAVVKVLSEQGVTYSRS